MAGARRMKMSLLRSRMQKLDIIRNVIIETRRNIKSTLRFSAKLAVTQNAFSGPMTCVIWIPCFPPM